MSIDSNNKQLALLALRTLISDIVEERVYVYDVNLETIDPRNSDPYSSIGLEQTLSVRTRLALVKAAE